MKTETIHKLEPWRKTAAWLLFVLFTGSHTVLADAPPPGVCMNVNQDNVPDDKGDETEEPVVLSNGNMTLTYEDASIKSLGPALELVRTYNAQQTSRIPGWLSEAGSWSIQDQTLVGKGDRFVSDAAYGNIVFEADMKTELPGLQNFHVGWLNFRYNDIANFYYFSIRRDGVLECTKVKNGITTQILFQNSTLNPLVWHTVRVEFIGSNLKIFVDGQQKLNYTDPDPVPTGRIGLNSYFSEVRYDNVEIEQPTTAVYNFNTLSKAEQSMFGYGWTSTYELHLEALPDGDVIVHRGTGVMDRFDWNGSTFLRPKLVYDTLTINGSGYDLKDRDAAVFHFDGSGKLLFIRDRSGNQATLSYSAGLLTGVTDAVGRTLQFIYGANGKVEYLTDPLGRQTHYLYNTHKDLTEVISPGDRHVSFTYDARHTMQTSTDREGHLYQFHYFYNERVSRQVDPLGNETTFFYFWDYTDVTNDRGETYRYTLIQDFLTESIIDPAGYVTQYDYDANFNRNRIVDKDGRIMEYVYDTNGNITSTTRYLDDGAPIVRQATFNLAWNKPIQTTDEKGRVRDYVYDANGNLLSLTRYLNNAPIVTQYEYNNAGQLIKETRPDNAVTEFEYDAWGHVSRVSEPLSRETFFSYDIAGRLVSVTDPNNHTTGFIYDNADNLLRVVYPGGSEVEMTYDKNKDVLSFSDELDHAVSFAYDAVRNRTQITDPLNKSTVYTYDSANFMHLDRKSLLSITDPNSHVTEFMYDARDKLIRSTNPLDFDTLFDRDGEGNLLTLTNARGNAYAFSYDDLGRMTTQEDPLSYLMQYSYDATDRVASRHDANGNITTYTYDDFDRLTDIHYPDASSIHFTYDQVGNRLSMTDSTGTTSYTYDLLDRLTSVTYPSGDAASYTYDAAGNRLSMTSRLGTRTYGYDTRNRLISINDSSQGLTLVEYDNAGRRTKLTYANGITANYAYSNRNDLTGIVYENAALQTIFSISYTHDDAGNITSMTDDTGTTQYFYDAADQLKEVRYPDGRVVLYTYDPVGNRITLSDSTGLHSSTYDAADRLLLLDAVAFTYDNNGNLTSESHPVNGITAYAYDVENRLTRVSKNITAFSTHLNPGWNFFSLPGAPVNSNISDILSGLTLGEDYDQLTRLNSTTRTFEHYIGNEKFDQFDTLEYGKGYEIFITKPEGVDLTVAGLTHPESGQVALNAVWNLIGSPSESAVPVSEALSSLYPGVDYDRIYRWNPDSGRYEHSFSMLEPGKSYWLKARRNTAWQIETDANVYARYIYNGEGERVAKRTTAGEIQYIHDVSNPLYETDETGAVTTSYMHSLFIDEMISERSNGQTRFRLNDHLGSLRKLTNGSGITTESLTYDAFGEPSSASSSRFLFTGRERDSETGLYYYRARTYQPSLGRFMSKDPLEFRELSNENKLAEKVIRLSNKQNAPSEIQLEKSELSMSDKIFLELLLTQTSINKYTYVLSNPVSYTDSSGQLVFGPALAYWGAIAGLLSTAVKLAYFIQQSRGIIPTPRGPDPKLGGRPRPPVTPPARSCR